MKLRKICSEPGDRCRLRVPVSSRLVRARFGFSLIELLVSISMIVLLTGIFLPALHRAVRVSAPLVKCSNNLRQLYQSVNLYLADSREVMPLADYQPLHESKYARLDVTLSSYGGNTPEMWICPLDDARQQFNPRRVSSYLYPISKYQQSRTRIYFNVIAQQFPIFIDRSAFHPVENPMSATGPSSMHGGGVVNWNPADQMFSYNPGPGYNRIAANGRVSAYPTSSSQ